MTHKFTTVTKDADSERVNADQTPMENSNVKTKQNADKTFEELVEESIRLPALSPSNHLPMTMAEILRSSQPSKDISTKLPQIHSGQVQLVTRRDGTPIERKRRRGKKTKFHRPERSSPRGAPDNTGNMRVSCAKQATEIDTQGTTGEHLHWKKTMHRRHSKRHITGEKDSVNVSITISGYQHYKEYRT